MWNLDSKSPTGKIKLGYGCGVENVSTENVPRVRSFNRSNWKIRGLFRNMSWAECIKNDPVNGYEVTRRFRDKLPRQLECGATGGQAIDSETIVARFYPARECIPHVRNMK